MEQHKNWVCIYKTSNRFEADAVQGNLESAEIPCVVLNKQDSSYLSFGYVELHVPDTYVQQANAILTDQSFDQ